MRVGVALVLLLLGACSPSRGTDSGQAVGSPAPSAGPSASALPASPGSASSATALPGAGPPNAAGLIPLGTPALVGMLVANEPKLVTSPSEYCLDDGKLYRGAPARIGSVNVMTSEALDALAGKLVVAYGVLEPSLLDALTAIGTCPAGYGDDSPELQMRSDWVCPEGGFRTSREKLQKLPWLRASSVRTVTLHQVVSKAEVADQAVVELRNPFDQALDALSAQLHYEGGPGKPMPKLVPLALALPPGGTQRVEAAARIEAGPAGADVGGPRGSYRLQSIDLAGTIGASRFEATLWVGVPRARKR